MRTNQPESVGSILRRILPSIAREVERRERARLMEADTVVLARCRCCGQLTEGELSVSGECPDCVNRLLEG